MSALPQQRCAALAGDACNDLSGLIHLRGAHHGGVVLDDAGLFKGNTHNGVAKVRLVVERHRRKDCHFAIAHIGGVSLPTNAHLNDSGPHTSVGKGDKAKDSEHLKEAHAWAAHAERVGVNTVNNRRDALPQFDELGLAERGAVNLDPLAQAVQMR